MIEESHSKLKGAILMATQANAARIIEDRRSLAALEGIAGYAPRNTDLSVAALRGLESQMDSQANRVTQLRAELAGAVDDYHKTGSLFTRRMTEARDEVQVQFGRDSNELQAVGRTKRSDRKAPVRKPKP
jgi:hypothetical protein